MGIFDRKPKAPTTPTKPKFQIPEPWQYAREITEKEANKRSELPLGWYWWTNGFKWWGIRPDPETGEHEVSWTKNNLVEVEEWLGIPAEPKSKAEPERLTDKITLRQKNYLEKMGLAEPEPEEQAPTEEENQWAEQVMLQELQELQKPEEPKEEKPKKQRKTLGRTNQIKTRLTDSELEKFQRRVKKSKLTQGDYIRTAVLNNKIIVNERSELDVAILDELAAIRAELGRQGGMLKMIIKPNEGQREIAPAEWEELIAAIHYIEETKKRFQELEVKFDGYRNTSKQ